MRNKIIVGDCLESLRTLLDCSVHCVITSPPYWGLRDYGVDGQLGLEKSPEEYVANMVDVFREVRRVLRDDGTLWLNLGDSYAAQRGGTTPPAETLAGGENGWMDDGSRVNRGRHDGYNPSRNAGAIGLKHKDLVGIPWRVAFALQADGYYLRQDLIWAKPNPMPESVRDRCTKSHEYLFLLSKSERYYFDGEAIKESFADERMGNPGGGGQYSVGSGRNDAGALKTGVWNADGLATGRNRRSVWSISTSPYKGAHFATFPPRLIEPCILAGTSAKGCCPTCGKPWERITERTKLRRQRPNDYTKRTGEEGTGNSCANSVAGVEMKTTGWQQSCKCEPAEPVPCIVADPFGGSGTTGMVAAYHGRDWLLFELNPEYAALAEQRIADGYTPPKVKKPKLKKIAERDLPDFSGGRE